MLLCSVMICSELHVFMELSNWLPFPIRLVSCILSAGPDKLLNELKYFCLVYRIKENKKTHFAYNLGVPFSSRLKLRGGGLCAPPQGVTIDKEKAHVHFGPISTNSYI